MKKYVIYSAIIGAYDNIKQPAVVDSDFDYILFSDCITENKIGVWEVRKIDFTHPISTKIARYVKTHPHTLLSEYECSLWIDASVIIKSSYFYKRVKELYANYCAISTLIHPERNCIYQEACIVTCDHLEFEDVVVDWIKNIHAQHYPTDNGLCETGILYRLQSIEVSQMNELWWECIDKYSRRDQLSFNYVLWKLHLHNVAFFPIGVSIRESELMELADHNDVAYKDVYKNNKMPLLLRVMYMNKQYEPIIMAAYLKAFHSCHPKVVINAYIMRLYPQYLLRKAYKNVKRSVKNILRLLV